MSACFFLNVNVQDFPGLNRTHDIPFFMIYNLLVILFYLFL